ncbi:unnamed protein product [Protopolystoma xenopodis]|uniref:Uncharacterized protein n=1 Tax=Protopolystoma xenopodis TaxID=117903 RepID=A0A3S4ZTR4_9PLAT|nr:unnamed protein product [Protopolystoma xenopodis]
MCSHELPSVWKTYEPEHSLSVADLKEAMNSRMDQVPVDSRIPKQLFDFYEDNLKMFGRLVGLQKLAASNFFCPCFMGFQVGFRSKAYICVIT